MRPTVTRYKNDARIVTVHYAYRNGRLSSPLFRHKRGHLPSCSCSVASLVNANSESVSVASEQLPDVPLVSVFSRAPGCWYVWFGLRCRWYWCCAPCWWRSAGWYSVASSSHSPSLLSPRCWYGWYALFAFPAKPAKPRVVSDGAVSSVAKSVVFPPSNIADYRVLRGGIKCNSLDANATVGVFVETLMGFPAEFA